MIQIFSITGEEFQFKRDTLTIKKENNSFTNEFKAAHSSFPFLIIENEIAKKYLGSTDITSISKKKKIEVIVIEFGVRYSGELQQLSIESNFRKCNLKYSSALLNLTQKKLNTLMDIVSVIPGETNPIPYSEESNSILSGTSNWLTTPVNMIGLIFPEVKYNFPTIYWKNKFGIDLDSNHPWYNYKDYINNFNFNSETNQYTFIENTGLVSGSSVSISNKNIPSPQLFLLSPIYYSLKSIGWKITGNFKDHELVKRLMIQSSKTNITKTLLSPNPISFTIPNSIPWELLSNQDFFGNNIYRKRQFYTGQVPGTYKVTWSFELLPLPYGVSFNFQKFTFLINGFYIISESTLHNGGNNIIISGVSEVEINSSNFFMEFRDTLQRYPVNYSISLLLIQDEKEYEQMHPTIDLNRYVPDLTFGSYLNAIKNFFNLDIIPNDLRKELEINIIESTVLDTPTIINKSHKVSNYDLTANTSFILKYENDIDEGVFITPSGAILYSNQKDDFTKTIDSKFKIIPTNSLTAFMSEEIESKEGIGLIIYSEVKAPYCADATVSGYNIKIPGAMGIYETFHKTFLKTRLNASQVEIITNVTPQEISMFQNKESIYLDNQHYSIISFEASEVSISKIQVKMVLESINI